MRSDIQKIKVYNLFQALDVENNGYLERADLDALARRLAEGQGKAQGSPLHAELEGKLRAFWNELVAYLDSNTDGRVSREEFLQFSRRIGNRAPLGAAEQGLQEVNDVIFTMADHDGSGTISEREFVQCMRSYGVSDSAAAAAFRLIDADRNSRITRDEWQGFLRDVFQSQALSDASALVFGPGSRGRM